MDEAKYSVAVVREDGSVQFVQRLVDVDAAVETFGAFVEAGVSVVVLIEGCIHLEWSLAEGLRKAAVRE